MYRLWQETHRQFRRLCGHRHRGRQSGKESGGNFGKALEITGRKAKGTMILCLAARCFVAAIAGKERNGIMRSKRCCAKALCRRAVTLLLTVAMCLSIPSISVSAAYNQAILGKKINAGTATKQVGEEGFYQRLPRSTNTCNTFPWIVLSEYIPDEYNNLDATHDDIISGDYAWGKFAGNDYGNSYIGTPCLQFNYTAVKPGRTSVRLYFEYGLHYV